MEILIINLLWAVCSMFFIVQHMPAMAQVDRPTRVAVFLLLVVGGPIFMAAAVLQSILTILLPEGWDDDDDGIEKH